MWSVMNNAAFKSPGNSAVTCLTASTPPADAPTTIMALEEVIFEGVRGKNPLVQRQIFVGHTVD